MATLASNYVAIQMHLGQGAAAAVYGAALGPGCVSARVQAGNVDLVVMATTVEQLRSVAAAFSAAADEAEMAKRAVNASV